MAVGSSLSSAGFRHLQVFQLYSNGLPYATVAGADAYAGLAVDVAKTFTPTIPEAQIIQITGDDRPKGQIVLPGNESVSIAITTGKSNMEVDALFSNVNVVTEGDQKFMVRESDRRGCEIVVGMLGYQQGIDNVAGSATRGQTVWRAFWVPKARVVALGGPMEEGNAMEATYTAYAQVVNAHLWGMVLTDAIEGATEAQLIEAFYNGPPKMDAWLIDAVPTVVLNLSGTAKADEGGTSFDINVYKWASATGLVTDITSGSTLAASTVEATGASEGDVVVAVYSQAGC